MKKGRIMITGSNGFVGSPLMRLLHEDFIVVGVDLKNYLDLFQLDNLHGIDAVVHLAALTNVRESMKEKDKYYLTNVLGTAHMLRLCHDYKVKMIYVSSAAAKQPESSPYAYTKYMAEHLVSAMQPSTRAVILRPFNIYGSNPPVGSLFYNALHDEKLTMYGDGSDTRDFISVWDVCQIIKKAIDESWESQLPIEIGTGQTTSVKQVIKIFKRYLNKEVVIKKHQGGIKKSVADTKLLRKLYKQKLITDLETDIQLLVHEYFVQKIGGIN